MKPDVIAEIGTPAAHDVVGGFLNDFDFRAVPGTYSVLREEGIAERVVVFPNGAIASDAFSDTSGGEALNHLLCALLPRASARSRITHPVNVSFSGTSITASYALDSRVQTAEALYGFSPNGGGAA